MRTREEMIAAINEVVKEAEIGGFVFCAGLDGGGISTIFITGNRLTSLGLTRLMHDCYLQDIELPNR